MPERRRAPGGYFYVPAPVSTHVQPLHETYLRVYELDLGDHAAVNDFVRQYGQLGVARMKFSAPEGAPGPTGYELEYLGNPPPSVDRALKAEREAIRQAPKPDDWDSFRWNFESLGEFMHGAGLIKDMVFAWTWINEGRPPATSDWASPNWKDSARHPPRNKEEAARFLEANLDQGLRFFPPEIALRGGLTDAWTVRPAKGGDSHLPLYPICCLQLTNHILEGASYRTCQKTDCRRRFVRQEGRAKQGQHHIRGEVMFCSDRCANTQAQRDRRNSKGARPRPRRGRSS